MQDTSSHRLSLKPARHLSRVCQATRPARGPFLLLEVLCSLWRSQYATSKPLPELQQWDKVGQRGRVSSLSRARSCDCLLAHFFRTCPHWFRFTRRDRLLACLGLAALSTPMVRF